MATKAVTIDQHIPLHNLYPDNCCLCKAEQRIKELEDFHEKHLKENKEYYENEIQKLTKIIDEMQVLEYVKLNKNKYEKEINKLKEQLFLSKEVCDICWTSSYLPVPKNTKDSLKVKGKDYNVICQMCEADKLILQLRKAICPDGSITKTTELIDLCKKLWDAYNKVTEKGD